MTAPTEAPSTKDIRDVVASIGVIVNVWALRRKVQSLTAPEGLINPPVSADAVITNVCMRG